MRVEQLSQQVGVLPEAAQSSAVSLLQSRQQVPQQRQAQLPRFSGGLFAKLSLKLQAKVPHVQLQGLQRQLALQPQAEGLQGRGLRVNLSSLSGNLKDKLQALRDQVALAPVLADVKQKLQAQAADSGAFNATLRQAFGDRFDAAKAETIRQQVLAGDYSWMPKIQVVSEKELADITGAQGSGVGLGAYAAGSDTVYLSRELLKDRAQASRTLLEEIGHGIDARINTADALGDEGEIFGRLVSSETLDAQTLQALQADNDRGAVLVGGKLQDVEYGFLKKGLEKIGKAVKKGVKKIAKAVVNSVVNVVKSAVQVAVGLATFDFDRVKEGFSQSINAVTTTIKEVHEAVKDTAQEIHDAAKELVKKALTSKLLGAILMVCRFIPIPIVQLVVRIVELARAAYMVYQGVKNKSLGMALSGVASLASGAAKYGSSFGASAATVRTLQTVSNVAGKVSMAYKAVAEKDLSAGLSLLTSFANDSATIGKLNAKFSTEIRYAQQGLAIGRSVRSGDALGVLSGALDMPGPATDAKLAVVLGNTRDVVNAARAVRALEQGNIVQADTLTSELQWAGNAATKSDAIVASGRAAMLQAAALQQTQALAGQVEQALAPASEPTPVQTQAVPDQEPVVVSLRVQRGQTLERIARQEYKEDWRAGLTQLVLDNHIKLNQWDSPLLREGQSLIISDLSDKTQQDLQTLSRTGGRIVAHNHVALQAKAQADAQAQSEKVARLTVEAAQAAKPVASPIGPSPDDMLAMSRWLNRPGQQDDAANVGPATQEFDRWASHVDQLETATLDYLHKQSAAHEGSAGFGGGSKTWTGAVINVAGVGVQAAASVVDMATSILRTAPATYDSWRQGTLRQDFNDHVLTPTEDFFKSIQDTNMTRLTFGAKGEMRAAAQEKGFQPEWKFFIANDRAGVEYARKDTRDIDAKFVSTSKSSVAVVDRMSWLYGEGKVSNEVLLEVNATEIPVLKSKSVAEVPIDVRLVPGLRENLTTHGPKTPSLNVDINILPRVHFFGHKLKVSLEFRHQGS